MNRQVNATPELPSSKAVAMEQRHHVIKNGESRSRSILIYRTGQLGDTLVSLPAIRAIRNAYPNHEFILLTDQQLNKGFVSSWEVLGATKIFSDVLFYAPPLNKVVGGISLLGLARRIRQHKPEALFCLRDPNWEHSFRDRIFFGALCGISHCHGVASDAYQIFGRRDSSGRLVPYVKEIDFLLNLVGRSGIPIPESGKADVSLPLSDKERSRVDQLWQEKHVPDEALLFGVAPGSKMPAKRWPEERFIEVGRWILEHYPQSRIVIIGGPDDRSQGDAIQKSLGQKVMNLAGELSILESAEALRRCRVYVGNDTGTMHLAAAAGASCVVIFSSRDHPGRWDPYGSNHVVLRTDPACAGCLLEVCEKEEMKCLKDISVNDVIKAIRHVIKQDVNEFRIPEVFND